jgi:hypothetical protein
MATAPADYLTLVHTGGSFNFAQYTAGGASPGTNVRTSYTRVRLNPSTLRVNIADQAFSTSTGSLVHSGNTPVTSMPYGTAADCMGPGSATGIANVDLTGTRLAINETFDTAGNGAAGSAVQSSGNQVANVTGGGFCGWTAPAHLFNPFNTGPWALDTHNGYDLLLTLTGPSDNTQCNAWQTYGSLFSSQQRCLVFLSSHGHNQPGLDD